MHLRAGAARVCAQGRLMELGKESGFRSQPLWKKKEGERTVVNCLRQESKVFQKQ